MRKILYLASISFILSLGFTACDSDDGLVDLDEQEILAKLEGQWLWIKTTVGVPGSKEEDETFGGRPPGVYVTIFKNSTTASTFNGQPEEPPFFSFRLDKAETCWGMKAYRYLISDELVNSVPGYIVELTEDRLITSTCGNDEIHNSYYERYKPEEK